MKSVEHMLMAEYLILGLSELCTGPVIREEISFTILLIVVKFKTCCIVTDATILFYGMKMLMKLKKGNFGIV